MWLDAEQAVAQHGQAYGIGDRTLTRADLREIRRQVAYWQREVSAWAAKAAGAGGPSHKVATWTG